MASLSTISLPAEYPYVLGSILLTAFVGQYHSILTGSTRKAAKIPYPNSYATHAEATADLEKYRFNCAQRAHSNFLENLPIMLVTSAIAGLKAPVATAALGLVWSIGRIVYAKGYVSSTQEQKGSGRLIGAWYMVAQLGLIGTAAWTVFGLVF